MKIRCLVILLAGLLALRGTSETVVPRNFGFGGVEIFDFEFGTFLLNVEDLDGDGLDDVVFINNRKSRLEVLFRKADAAGEADDGMPSLDARFDDRGMVVDQQLQTYRLVDLDGDGLLDLLTFGTLLGLNHRRQVAAREFGEAQRIHIAGKDEVMCVQAEDLDGDARPDIVLGRRGGLDILWNREGAGFTEKQSIPFAEENCRWLDLCDLDDDGEQDILLFVQSREAPMRVRLGRGQGRFGLEHSLTCPPMRYTRLLRPEVVGTPRIGCVLNTGLGARLYGFKSAAQHWKTDIQEVTCRKLPVLGAGKGDAPAWVASDFDGDGFEDMLLAAPELSQLHLYTGNRFGFAGEPERIDTLSGVSGMSLLAGGDVLVVSEAEKVAALHARSSLQEFPRIIDVPGDVIAGGAVSGTPGSCLVCRNEDESLSLHELDGDGSVARTHALDLDNAPNALAAFAIDGNGIGVILFMPYAPPVMFRVVDDELQPVTQAAFRALSDTLTPGDVVTVRDNGVTGLYVAKSRTVRGYRFDGERFATVAQYNPENPQADVAACCAYTDADGVAGVMLYDADARDLVWYPEADDRARRIHVANPPPGVSALAHVRSNGNDMLVLVGRKELALLLDGAEHLELVAGPEYLSPAEDVKLGYLDTVKLGADLPPMLALLDHGNHAVELVALAGSRLAPQLVFDVFHDTGFGGGQASGKREPHYLSSGDLDGDGRGDLLVLVHDKLLVYPGE